MSRWRLIEFDLTKTLTWLQRGTPMLTPEVIGETVFLAAQRAMGG